MRNLNYDKRPEEFKVRIKSWVPKICTCKIYKLNTMTMN